MSDIKRACGLLVIEVENSNPNGDPDRDGDPRQRPDGLGEISPVSFKRKLRDIVEAKNPAVWKELKENVPCLNDDGFCILETRERVWKTILQEIHDNTFRNKYWDARLFGNTFLEGEDKVKESFKGESKEGLDARVREVRHNIRTGVVQFGVGVSVKPITIRRNTQTKKAGAEEGKEQGMAPLGFRFVEYGVYVMPFFVNPNAADKSGCTATDVELMLRLIPAAYPLNPSTVRTMVAVRVAHYIEHKKVLGSFAELEILRKLTPRLRPVMDKTNADRFLGEYEVPTWDSVKGEYADKYHLYRELVSDKRDPKPNE
ncbi:MAG: hypothetical protein A2340_05280 [Lentisphaerae bacterium RIFOXYB12_FULL_60_10]|nr:MAG: hypothetical protein A2340_05280 [Lentisphaerae bacterium RIFOXYB12_FULL_60_10]